MDEVRRFCTAHAATPAEWLADLGATCAEPGCTRTVASVGPELIGGIACHVVTTEPEPPGIDL